MNEPDETNPLHCDEVSLRLSGLLAGELADAEARALERHVAACARCARERADLEALERLFVRDATPAPADLAAARMGLRRALAHEPGAAATPTAARATAPWHTRILWREVRHAAGFALLLALFVPIFPRLHRELAPAGSNDVTASLAHEAHDLVASVGAWLPSLPEWKLPAAPPESLRAWFDALHSDAH
jgi:anti-sigma factor RsiW